MRCCTERDVVEGELIVAVVGWCCAGPAAGCDGSVARWMPTDTTNQQQLPTVDSL